MSLLLSRRRAFGMLCVATLSGVGIFANGVPAYAQDSGVSAVRSFTGQLLRIGTLPSARERYARLAPLVRQAFDVSGMTRIAVGSAWSGLSGAEQASIEREFSSFIAANYANRLSTTAGTTIEVDPNPSSRGGQKLVKTEFVEANGARTVVSYAMRGSRIADVYLDGSISELATRRAEFTGIVASSGATGLIEQLRQRTARFIGG